MYLWLVFSLINCCFSYFWDIERDWDIQWFTASTGVPSNASVLPFLTTMDTAAHSKCKSASFSYIICCPHSSCKCAYVCLRQLVHAGSQYRPPLKLSPCRRGPAVPGRQATAAEQAAAVPRRLLLLPDRLQPAAAVHLDLQADRPVPRQLGDHAVHAPGGVQVPVPADHVNMRRDMCRATLQTACKCRHIFTGGAQSPGHH